MILKLENSTPEVKAIYVATNSSVIGRVTLGDLSSVWFSATIRGDMAEIGVGTGTNVQDGAVLHVDFGFPLKIGTYVTVGHQAILHGCSVADNVLIGMGSRVLNGAIIESGSIVGAGALVPPGKHFPPRSLLVGVPARAVREVTDSEIEEIRVNAEHYIENAKKYAAELDRIE